MAVCLRDIIYMISDEIQFEIALGQLESW